MSTDNRQPQRRKQLAEVGVLANRVVLEGLNNGVSVNHLRSVVAPSGDDTCEACMVTDRAGVEDIGVEESGRELEFGKLLRVVCGLRYQ